MNDERFNQIYNEIMNNSEEELKSARKTSFKEQRKRIVLIVILTLVMIIINMKIIRYDYKTLILILPIMIIVCGILFYLIINYTKDKIDKYENLYLDKVVRQFLKSINMNANINLEQKITQDIYNLGNFEGYNKYYSKALIEGYYDSYTYQLSWLKTEGTHHSTDGVEYYTIFNGLVAKIDFKKQLPNLCIRKKPNVFNIPLTTHKNEIKTGLDEFDSKYYIYTDNEELVKGILKVDFINQILYLNSKYNDTFDFTIKDNHLFIRIFSSDIFHPSDLSKTHIYKCYNSLCFMFESLSFLINKFK